MTLQCLNLCWVLINSSPLFFQSILKTSSHWAIKLVHKACYDAKLDPASRRRAGHLLGHLAHGNDYRLLSRAARKRRNAAAEASTAKSNGLSTLAIVLGQDALLDLCLELVADSEESLRCTGALLMTRLRLSRRQHASIRQRESIPRLVRLATESESPCERRCALLALLRCAESAPTQELVARIGLYRLLVTAWTC
jgi:hypothetical protein